MSGNDVGSGLSERDLAEDKQGFFLLVQAVAAQVEQEQQISLVVDQTLCGECFERSLIGLDHITGIESPEIFKVAAEHAFWIRKLKPCRVDIPDEQLVGDFRDEVLKCATAEGLDVDKIESVLEAASGSVKYCPLAKDGKSVPAEQFVNEFVAIRVAIKLLEAEDIFLTYNVDLFRDLISTIRYNSLSPGSLRMILEAMDPPEMDVRPTKRYHATRAREAASADNDGDAT